MCSESRFRQIQQFSANRKSRSIGRDDVDWRIGQDTEDKRRVRDGSGNRPSVIE
jgi:hypothetical protein